ESSGWYAASLIQKVIDVSVQEEETHVNVFIVYALSIHPDAKVTVMYTVYANGSMKIRSSYEFVKGLPDIPIHALYFNMTSAFHNSEWYANGTETNYVDRANGARICRFTNRIEDNVDAYSVLQEYASRTGVRAVAIT